MTASSSISRAVIVTPDQATAIKPYGLDAKILLTTEASGGATSVLIVTHKSGEGPPDHLHFHQEEIFFILEGIYELTIGGETSTAIPGTIVFIPRNTVHRFRNISAAPGRMLDWSLPGGQDRHFKMISDLAADGGFTGEKVMEINRRFDTHFPGG